MDDLRANRLADVESLLYERIGLNPRAVHRAHIEDAVRERMAACGVASLAQYLARVQSSPQELQELIECAVVVESWFFRDLQPFRFLERHVREGGNARRPWRLLSVPCGAGEEPFSMAMTLLNMGLDATRFRVDGVDISQRALGQARDGSYSESSFRERAAPVADFRARFFHPLTTRMSVNDEVRATVRFQRGNLLDAGILGDVESYDVIFCRNLLIYLDADARRTVFATLHRLLAKDGVLYVGHVEGGTLRDERFDAYDATFPFAFRARRDIDVISVSPLPLREGPGVRAEDSESRRFRPHAQPLSQEERGAEPSTKLSGEPAPAKASAPIADPQADFEAPRALANRGRLDDAAARCLELMAQHPANADVYCLLGVIRQAQGNIAEAEKCFQKAVYLDPRHHESLVHLALLATQRGEESTATNYRRRADKLKVAE